MKQRKRKTFPGVYNENEVDRRIIRGKNEYKIK